MSNLLPGDKAFQAIQQGLILGRWRPGDSLPLQALAKELDVSYTPLREAVNELVRYGVLERNAGVGTSVARHAPEEIANLGAVRAALEGLAARWLAERASDVVLATLRAEAKALDELLIGAYEEISRLGAGPEFDNHRLMVTEAEDQFHHNFVENGGGPLLVTAWRPCHFTLLAALTATYLTKWQPAVEQLHRHARVMQAVCSHDPDLAEETAREHVLAVWRHRWAS